MGATARDGPATWGRPRSGLNDPARRQGRPVGFRDRLSLVVARAVVPSMAAVAAIIGPVAPMVAVVVVPAVVMMMMACVMLPMVTGGIISTVTRLADAHSAEGERCGRSDEGDKA